MWCEIVQEFTTTEIWDPVATATEREEKSLLTHKQRILAIT